MSVLPFKDRLLVQLALGLLKTIHFSCRWQLATPNDPGHLYDLLEAPCIIVFWHGQQLSLAMAQRGARQLTPHSTALTNAPFHMLSSQHRDGRLIAHAIEQLGLYTIAGSSTRGGRQAIRAMRRVLEQNSIVGITPDGPKGPAHTAKAGAAKLALSLNVPIIACALHSSRRWTFSSWDAMFLAKPFSTLTLAVSERLSLDPALSPEEATQKVQELLDRTNSALHQQPSAHLDSAGC